MDILSEIHQIIKKDYPEIKEKITPKTKFKDVKIDSLKLVMIVIKIEEKHNVKINDNKLLDLQTKTVQDLINEIKRLVAIEKNKKK
ncbi:acyl carrier protein [Spiroplasma endosymbiont of Colias croceus]|uniref:acyl carrier protein n=1 Tax=Spiroplasma endosymbiont of Colias croceus TaxID=3066310 RepID=UPI0030CC12BC